MFLRFVQEYQVETTDNNDRDSHERRIDSRNLIIGVWGNTPMKKNEPERSRLIGS